MAPRAGTPTLNSLYQLSLPRWIKALGMSFYLMVFQGGGAVGAAVMGLTAEHAGLALGPLAGLGWDRLDRIRELTDPAHPVAVTHWLAVTRRKPDAPSRPVPSAAASPASASTATTAPPAP
jgi:hypothetical protein